MARKPTVCESEVRAVGGRGKVVYHLSPVWTLKNDGWVFHKSFVPTRKPGLVVGSNTRQHNSPIHKTRLVLLSVNNSRHIAAPNSIDSQFS